MTRVATPANTESGRLEGLEYYFRFLLEGDTFADIRHKLKRH